MLIHPPAVVEEMTLRQARVILETLAEQRDEEVRLRAALAGVELR